MTALHLGLQLAVQADVPLAHFSLVSKRHWLAVTRLGIRAARVIVGRLLHALCKAK